MNNAIALVAAALQADERLAGGRGARGL